MRCRHCYTRLTHTFLDLGFAPPSNAYLTESDLQKPEKYYPLKIMVCSNCWLVQTLDFTDADELFSSDYAYFSSTSMTWLNHAKEYCEKITKQLALGPESFVVEVASNDGYLLKNFLMNGIPCLGIEPTASTADAAIKLGIPVIQKFFGESLGIELSSEGKQADLIIGNNVYAHVPNINDFTKGLKAALKPNGTITLEFPHLLELVKNTQFDTIYHEHFSYLSLYTVNEIFKKHGLRIFNVDRLTTHGGSLRIYGCHNSDMRVCSNDVNQILRKEREFGLQNLETYFNFQQKVEEIKNELLEFLIKQKKEGKTVVAYGAAAKGNTLLNFAGVKQDLVSFVCDAASSKQGKFLPGSHISIVSPEILTKNTPDYVLVLPWNILDEVIFQNSFLLSNGTKFLTAVPDLKLI